ncbi:MAG: ammonium transporter, partial [Bacteroidales bacterium]|nr:ammonium transporter [Bacteroidales bacterium]
MGIMTPPKSKMMFLTVFFMCDVAGTKHRYACFVGQQVFLVLLGKIVIFFGSDRHHGNHISAGFAALAFALVIRPRRGFGNMVIEPHNIPYTVLGAGLLWMGWFGFNG